MGRPARHEAGTGAGATLTLRLTKEDKSLLEQLVRLRSAELVQEGVEPTVASYVRGLIRREAAAKGLTPDARSTRPAASVSRTREPTPPRR